MPPCLRRGNIFQRPARMAPGSRIAVRIVDDGPGVPPDLRERIFTPRFTTKNGRVEFGLGLGLSISRQIVDDHGGSIRLQSAAGRTEFVIELPTGAADE